MSSSAEHEGAQVYPLYPNMGLIRLVDHQPVISAILLFQYDRLVAKIVAGLEQMNLKDRKVLITSRAFGDVSLAHRQCGTAGGRGTEFDSRYCR